MSAVYAVDNQGTTWRECATFLAGVLNGAKVETGEQRVVYACIGANLLSREEQKKPCQTCGHPKHDFSWWRVTSAGRILINALNDQVQP